ncbi:curved DNA-binding protein-like [Hibiscus syriacus]|uniref:curved DNA-binding protein-like n=1 Tax=Hibiscus syriacus TaxID=106335 RepID=UPI0019208BEF|nr:curved DNA-binding protein-like [Hibiscus syriacus]
MDVVGAKRFALKAENLYPKFDDEKINGEVDWYRVLDVRPYADEDTIRKHYRKLALIRHPNKNKSVGAEEAFKVLSEDWNLLSDKTRRISYNQKRNLRGSYMKFPQVHNAGWDRFSDWGSSTKFSQTGAFHGSASNINVALPASFAARVAGDTHPVSKTLKRSRKESKTGTRTGKACK